MSEQVGTTKRKPGRPRKLREPAEGKLSSLMDIMDMANDMNMSRQATRRRINNDLDASCRNPD